MERFFFMKIVSKLKTNKKYLYMNDTNQNYYLINKSKQKL